MSVSGIEREGPHSKTNLPPIDLCNLDWSKAINTGNLAQFTFILIHICMIHFVENKALSQKVPR